MSQAHAETPPKDLPSTLRREHDLKKTSRYSHASNLLQILKESANANETKRRTLLQNGLSDALVDILLDIYSSRVIPEDELFLHYVEDILGSLAECAILMMPLIGSETSLQYIDVDAFLQKVVRLWNVMWTKRHCMKVKVRRYCSVAAGFIVSFCGLYQKFYKRQPGIEERAAHLLVYCWVFNEDLVLGDWIVPYMFLLICSPESHAHMGRFIQEAVVNALEPTRFVVAVLNQLYYSLNQTLKQLILILGGFTCIAPKLLEDDEMGNLLICIGRACQRQICKGEEDMVYDVVETSIMFISKERLEASNPDLEQVVAKQAQDHMLVPIAAHCICRAVIQNNAEYISHTVKILNYHIRVSTSDSRASSTYMTLKRVSRKIWFSTLRDLCMLQLDGGASGLQSYIISEWLHYGSQLGFQEGGDEADGDETPARTMDSETCTTPSKSHGCHYAKCLCNGHAFHHPAKLCRGCKAVLYCSKRCQTSDWKEGGHKSFCRKKISQSIEARD